MLTVAAGLLAALVHPVIASAAAAPVGLGTVGSYSVLGGVAVTNTGSSTLFGDLGASPGYAITGFPPGLVGGSTHAADAQSAQAQSDLTIAYNDAAGRAPDASVAGDLVGRTLTPGVYNSSGTLAVTGTLTLDGQGNPNSVFIIQIASTLTTGSASAINVVNGAQACNIYWQVGSSATLGTGSSFQGTVMALTSITVTTGTTVKGRALARNGQVTLDTNAFTSPLCQALPTVTPSATSSAVATSTPTTTATASHPAGSSAPRTSAARTSAVALPTVSDTNTTQQIAAGAAAAQGLGVSSRGPELGPTARLAQTGASPPLILGLLLAAAGAILVAIGRRRRSP